ncbi:MAG TPA: hypothetical protein VF292_02715 [Rhodanobacteraceae bacterium]
MKKFLVAAIACALAGGMSVAAFAQSSSAQTEINTAHAHALMAESATTVAMAHTHLHHVINCLVGPKGAGFDAAAGVPCKGQGNGAIPDSASDASQHAKLETALADAQAGLKATSLTGIHKEAAKVAGSLGATPAQKPKGGYSW